jgi:hypothetical protein
MRVLIGFTFGTIATLLATSHLLPGQTQVHEIVETRTVTNEILTTLDLEELRHTFDGLAQELRDECIRVLERTSDLPATHDRGVRRPPVPRRRLRRSRRGLGAWLVDATGWTKQPADRGPTSTGSTSTATSKNASRSA